MTSQATGRLHVLLGPVGAGKTTYALQCVARSGGLLLDLDSSMVRLYGDDPRPATHTLEWYLERRERCRGLLWDIALRTLTCGTDVYLEIGLLQVLEREALYEQIRTADLDAVLHVLDVPRDVRRARVEQRNQSATELTQIVPLDFFESASDAWEPLTARERERWPVIDV